MFRSLSFAGVLMLGGLTAFEASAQRYDDGRYRPNPAYDDGHYRPGGYPDGNGPAYDYARVVRVDPIIVGSGQGRGSMCACFARLPRITVSACSGLIGFTV